MLPNKIENNLNVNNPDDKTYFTIEFINSQKIDLMTSNTNNNTNDEEEEDDSD